MAGFSLPTMRFFMMPHALLNAKATEGGCVEKRRRAWTADYTALVFDLWDARRELEGRKRLGAARRSRSDLLSAAAAAAAGGGDAEIAGLEAAKADVERRLRERFPGMLQDGESGAATHMSRAACDAVLDGDRGGAAERAQMVKDFARETVVVDGVPVTPADADAYGRLHAAIRGACVRGIAGVGEGVAASLADAALRACWRTRVGADAWDRARKHLRSSSADRRPAAFMEPPRRRSPAKAPRPRTRSRDAAAAEDSASASARSSDDGDDAEYALVSRSTEPRTSIAVDGDRLVIVAHSHLAEVRCDAAESPGGGRCGDERAFIPIATRTTVSLRDPAGDALWAERVVLSVVLVEGDDARSDAGTADDPPPEEDPSPAAPRPLGQRLLSWLRSPD